MKFHRLLGAMSDFSKFTQFEPGDTVYARFFGSDPFVVVAIGEADRGFPCYICQRKSEFYSIPKILLSTKDLLPLVEDGNHRQVALPLA